MYYSRNWQNVHLVKYLKYFAWHCASHDNFTTCLITYPLSPLFTCYPQGKFRLKKKKPNQEENIELSKSSNEASKLKPVEQSISVKQEEDELPDLKDPEVQKATSLIQVKHKESHDITYSVLKEYFWAMVIIRDRMRIVTKMKFVHIFDCDKCSIFHCCSVMLLSGKI